VACGQDRFLTKPYYPCTTVGRRSPPTTPTRTDAGVKTFVSRQSRPVDRRRRGRPLPATPSSSTRLRHHEEQGDPRAKATGRKAMPELHQAADEAMITVRSYAVVLRRYVLVSLNPPRSYELIDLSAKEYEFDTRLPRLPSSKSTPCRVDFLLCFFF
jgi:hypothetical protein